MKHLLFSIGFPLVVFLMLLGHWHFMGAPFPPIDIMWASYLLSVILIMLTLFNDKEMEILHVVLFALATLTLIVSLPLDRSSKTWSAVNYSTTLFSSGFLACYVKYWVQDKFNEFIHRHF